MNEAAKKKVLEEIEAAKKEGRVAYLEGAYLYGADLKGVKLKGANLKGANLGGAHLQRAYLKGANLRGANLGVAYLEGAYLVGADLQGVNLEFADLEGANLRDADLQGANLEGAYLQGAYLHFAKGILEFGGGGDWSVYLIRGAAYPAIKGGQCRWWTGPTARADAIKYWEKHDNKPHGLRGIRRTEALLAEAKILGWEGV